MFFVWDYSKSNFYLPRSFRFFFFKHKGLFFFKHKGFVVILRLPGFYFFRQQIGGVSFLFYSSSYFNFFFQGLRCQLHLFFYFLKLKVRGLGYRIRKLASSLLRFFIGTTNFLFFHVPEGLLALPRRRRLFLLALDRSVLHLVFSHLLLLKQLIPYKLRGLFFPKQVILLKPGKKSF